MTAVIATLALITTLSSGPGLPAAAVDAGQQAGSPEPVPAPVDVEAIRQRVEEGQTVRVTDDQGWLWQGRVQAFAPDNLVLLTKDGQRRDVPYAAIVRIDRPHDGLGNGALIGLLSGAAFGLLAVVAEESATCEPEGFFSCGDPAAAAYLVIPAFFGGVGAGIGVGIDALIRRDPTLYRRANQRVTVTPSLGPGLRGVNLSVRW